MTVARPLAAALICVLLFAAPVAAGGSPTSSSSPATLVTSVGTRPTTTTIRIRGSESGDSLVVGRTEYINAYATTVDAGGSVDLPVTGYLQLWVDGIELAGGTLPPSASFGLPSGILTLGTHQVEAIFIGEGEFQSSTAAVFFDIVAETVEATGVKLDLTTFYPIADGYRDVVHAVGNRLEPVVGGDRRLRLEWCRPDSAWRSGWARARTPRPGTAGPRLDRFGRPGSTAWSRRSPTQRA